MRAANVRTALLVASGAAAILACGQASAQSNMGIPNSPAGHTPITFGGVVIWEDDSPPRDPNDPTQMTEAEWNAYLDRQAAKLPPRAADVQSASAAAAAAFGAAVQQAISQAETEGANQSSPQNLVDDGAGGTSGDEDFGADLQSSLADTAITGPESAEFAAIYANYNLVLGQNGSTVMLVPSSLVNAPSDVMSSLDLQPALCGR